MINVLIVGLGGFVGASLRYLIGLIHVSEGTLFPVKTFAINVIGCIAIGCITAAAVKYGKWDPRWILFLKTGICGGFTTFSTFALETTELWHGGHTGIAVLYAMLSLLVGCAVIFGAETIINQ